ncbi:fungal-specific transcription factor domain-containing protein, partial [Mycena belliarum]
NFRRHLVWDRLPWEKEVYDQRPRYVYPPSDLISTLLDLYFNSVHPILPVLHRPSFERSVAEGLHLNDTQFGATLLAMLGIASRYSNDPRVFVDGDTTLSSGWIFVKQLEVVRKLFEPTLYDMQFYCLMALFSLGTSAPETAWLYMGIGIRSIQQRGEHRRKRQGGRLDPARELWNRAFWSLMSLDRLLCLFLGRPTDASDHDQLKVDLPLAVDDEYWEQGSAQPVGTPSLLSYFVCHVRLYEILGDALRRLYPSKKARIRMNTSNPEWERSAVAELDSAMNDWLDTVPDHLRWDPDKAPSIFLKQSAVLYTTYYSVQITIHRPHIYQSTKLAAPSLLICTSAARSVLHIADVWLEKVQELPLPYMTSPVFISGIILMLNVFGSKRAGLSIDNNRDFLQVETAFKFQKSAGSR